MLKDNASTAQPICRACGQTTQRTFRTRERYAGMSGEFLYGECGACGALSIAEVPVNLAEFYRGGYYSFANTKPSWRARFLCGHDLNRRAALRSIPRRDSRVLDVGCGAGHLLQELAERGYTQLSGADPFLPEDRVGKNGAITLLRESSSQLQGQWDVVMYHHALEHVADPIAEMKIAARLLAPGGRLLVRVPLADSWLREVYGVDWYQWDAPRHLWLPTRRAMHALGKQAGLTLHAEWQDPAQIPIFASRLYARGHTAQSPQFSPIMRRKIFLRQLPQITLDRLRMHWTRLVGRADQGCFLFRKPL